MQHMAISWHHCQRPTVPSQPTSPHFPFHGFGPALGEAVDACEMRACLTRYCTPSLSQVATRRGTLPPFFPSGILPLCLFYWASCAAWRCAGIAVLYEWPVRVAGLYGALHLCFLPELAWPQLDDLAARVRWTPTLDILFESSLVTSAARTRTRTEHRLKLRLRHRNGRPKWIDR